MQRRFCGCVVFVVGQKEYVQGAGPGGAARCVLGSFILPENSITEYADKNQRGQGNIRDCVKEKPEFDSFKRVKSAVATEISMAMALFYSG